MNKYILNTYYVAGPVLGTAIIIMNKRQKLLSPWRGEIDNKQNIYIEYIVSREWSVLRIKTKAGKGNRENVKRWVLKS